MSETVSLEKLARTVEQQALAIARLNERLEDLEDLQELQRAMAANAGFPLHTWGSAREELGLTDQELATAARESRSGD